MQANKGNGIQMTCMSSETQLSSRSGKDNCDRLILGSSQPELPCDKGHVLLEILSSNRRNPLKVKQCRLQAELGCPCGECRQHFCNWLLYTGEDGGICCHNLSQSTSVTIKQALLRDLQESPAGQLRTLHGQPAFMEAFLETVEPAPMASASIAQARNRMQHIWKISLNFAPE